MGFGRSGGGTRSLPSSAAEGGRPVSAIGRALLCRQRRGRDEMDRIMRQLAAEEGYAHALCGLGTLVLLGVLLLIAAASVPATAGFGADLVWNGLLLLLALVVPAADAAPLGAWPG